MFCYETLKEILFPDLRSGSRYLMTICFGSGVAVLTAKVVLRKMEADRRRVLREVTERKEAEEALWASQAHLQVVVENLDEGVVVCDIEGRLLHWNSAALQLHGYSNSEQDHRHLTELADTFALSTLDGVAIPLVEQWPLARILRGEHLSNLELRIQRIGTDWQRVFNYGGNLVRGMNGQPLMAIVTICDVTQCKRVEDEFEEFPARRERPEVRAR